MKKSALLTVFAAAWIVATAPVFGQVPKPSDKPQDPVAAFAAQVKAYSAAVTTFKDMYQAMPGDMLNASVRLVGCPGPAGSSCDPLKATAGDNIIGRPDFLKTLKPEVMGKVRIPAVDAGDETILFWSDLRLANLINSVNDAALTDGSDIAFGSVLPGWPAYDAGFIVGHGDNTPLPKSLSPVSTGMGGTLIVLISNAVLSGKAELNALGQQPLSPAQAAAIDRKMDDGRPGTGYVQAYGAPACFDDKGGYAEANKGRDCGLIFRIEG